MLYTETILMRNLNTIYSNICTNPISVATDENYHTINVSLTYVKLSNNHSHYTLTKIFGNMKKIKSLQNYIELQQKRRKSVITCTGW